MSDECSPLLLKLHKGKTLSLDLCRCSKCENEFFVPSIPNGEGDPNYCPFCGLKFFSVTITTTEV